MGAEIDFEVWAIFGIHSDMNKCRLPSVVGVGLLLIMLSLDWAGLVPSGHQRTLCRISGSRILTS